MITCRRQSTASIADRWQALIRYQSSRSLAFVVMLGLTVLIASCANERALLGSGQTERSLASQVMTEDHLAATLLYQQRSEQLEADAGRYQQIANQLRPEVDPKGIQRAGLLTAAAEIRQRAAELFRLADTHRSAVLKGQLPTESGQ